MLFDGNAYLAEQYQISYAPSISTLLYTSRIQPVTTSKKLIIAHPIGKGVDPLSGARPLTEYLKKLYNTESYEGTEATIACLVEHASISDVIWIISHVEYRPDAPMQSSVILCQPTSSGSVKDEITAQKWLDLQLKLQADLLASIGCQLSYGAVDSDAMELLGLPRAILHSGVRTFIGPNWKIDVDAGVKFLTAFADHYYRYSSKTEALQHAQKHFINHKNSIYRHPYFWGAFRLSGAPD